MDKVRLGIIGLGNMGSLHMQNAIYMNDVEVIAVADQSERALKRASSLGINGLYSDYQKMLDKESKNLDGVVISLPNFLHFDSVKLSIESGLNVFVEKPLARNLVESQQLVQIVEKSRKKLMLGYGMRYIDAIEKMKAVADMGRLGSLELLTMESIQNGPLSHGMIPKPISEWWFDPQKSGGGALLDIGSHLIDLFHFFVGDSKVLFCHLDYKYNLPVEDGATLILKSINNSTRGVINVGWFQKTIFPKFNFRFVLHGMADFVSTEELIPRNIYVHAVKEGSKNFLRRITGRKIHPLSFTYFYESYYKEIRHYIDYIEGNSFPVSSAIDGLKTMEIVDEAYSLNRNKADE